MFGILRTLLAINVVLLHIFNVPTLGNYSVSFFFILSGFLMTFIVHNTYGYSVNGFKIFWINRFLRLFPIYYFIMLITIVFVIVLPSVTSRHNSIFLPSNFIEWIANITMLYPEIVPHRFNPKLVPTSWALTNELIFYFLISFGISKTFKRTLLWFLLSVAYFIGTYFFYNIATYRYSAVFASSLPFAIGALLFWVVKWYPLKKVKLKYIILLYILFLLNAYYKLNYSLLFKEISIYLNIILATIIIYFSFFAQSSSKLKSIDNYIGMYSYPIYLGHYLVAIIYVTCASIGINETNFKMDLVALSFYSLFLISFCFICVHFIDFKMNRLKSKIKKSI